MKKVNSKDFKEGIDVYSGIKDYFETGTGSIVIRSKCEVKEVRELGLCAAILKGEDNE